MTKANEKDARQDGEPTESWLTTILRVFVHAISAAVIVWPLAVNEGVFAAATGSAIGSLASRFVAKSRLRTLVIVALVAGPALVVWAIHFLVVEVTFLPEMFGPANALLIGDAVLFGCGALLVSLVLRLLSARRPSFAILEAGLAAGGVATLLIAHRNGAIHRPYAIADPLIAENYDPTLAILGIGLLGALVIGLLLLSERSLPQAAFHFVVIVVLLLIVFLIPVETGLPTPPMAATGGLGLQDDDSQQQSGPAQADDESYGDSFDPSIRPDAVVLFHDDYSAPGGFYYYRQTAFSQYNGLRLIASSRTDADQDVRNLFPTNRARDVQSPPREGPDRVRVETTIGLMGDNSAPVGLESPVRFIPTTNPSPARFRRVYRVESLATVASFMDLLDRPVGNSEWSAELTDYYLVTPDDSRYGELASRITSALPPDLMNQPIAQVFAITQWLGEHGIYSMRTRHAHAADPTADFLFGDMTGYCVHFAHAAVYLMREAGLPARVGTGYGVAEANREGGSALILRNSDQHAWPEVYFEGIGWVIADVEPATVLDAPGEPPDPRLQQLLAEMLRGANPLEDAPAPPGTIETFMRDAEGVFWQVVVSILAFVLFVLLIALFIKHYRRAYFSGATPRHLYRAALERLSENGIRRRWGESPEAFARRCASSYPSFQTLTYEHLSVAFGRDRDSADVARAMYRHTSKLSAELSAAVPSWRLVLGALNPVSWVLTR